MREDDLPEPGGRRGDFVSPGAWKEFSPLVSRHAKELPTRTSGLLRRVAGLINVRGACVLCGQERVHSPHRESERREEEEREREKRRRKRESAKDEI